MLLHVEVDVDHARELDELIDTLPLTEQQQAVIGASALQTIIHLGDALLDAVNHAATVSVPHPGELCGHVFGSDRMGVW